MLLLLASLALQHPSPRPPDLAKRAHTYSIVAYDSASGDLGVAVQSKFPNVGGIVPWAQAGVGAVATQSLGNTDYGEKGLELLARGATRAAWHPPRCSSCARMPVTWARTTATPTSVSTTTRTPFESSSGCTSCTSSTSSRAAPRT